jgi:UDP-N-acetylglucosamine 1-carboxyvinyltransferase
MEQFVIQGPTKLQGKVTISGSKNAALPIIAATALIKGKVTLKNIPNIKDVTALADLLCQLGAFCEYKDNTLTIDATTLKSVDPDPKLIRNLRASILLISPLLVRNKKISLPHPGGCLIGARPIDVHLVALTKMGAEVAESSSEYTLSADSLKGAEVTADFSVTGTENIVMGAVLAKGETKVNLAAAEPHVADLCNFLNKAGAKISGIGTHELLITGVKELSPVDHEVIFDQIEAGTFAIAAAASKGEVTIEGFVAEHNKSLLSKFEKSNVNFEILNETTLKVFPSTNLKPFKVRTEIYPGFPTDLQAPMAVLATQADGTSEIYETIFEGRLGYINELSKMGASCVIRDAHQASITGPTPLFGTRITSFDLRAGATLIIAAILAKGESRLDQIEIVDRGYENLEQKLTDLGANIKRVKLKEV